MIKKTETPKFDSFRKMGRGLVGIRKSIHWRTLNFYVFSFFVLVLALSTVWTNPKPMQAEGPYIITATAGANGSISPLGDSPPVEEEGSVTYTITPAGGAPEGYRYGVDEVRVDGGLVATVKTYTSYNVVEPVETYTFPPVMANHTIYATFKLIKTYTITTVITPPSSPNICSNTITPGTTVVDEGSQPVFTAIPDTANGCHLIDLLIETTNPYGEWWGEEQNFWDFPDGVFADHTFTAVFDVYPTRTFNISTDGNGAVTPTTVTDFCNRNFVIAVTPNDGYEPTEALLNGSQRLTIIPGAPPDAPFDYPYSMNCDPSIINPATLQFLFQPQKNRYTIGSSIEQSYKPYPCGGGRHHPDCRLWGTISPNTTVRILEGNSQTYTISYTKVGTIRNTSIIYRNRLVDVLVDGVSVGPVETYTFSNVMANHNIKAIIAEYFDVNVINPSWGGTITPSGLQQVDYLGNFSFEVKPKNGYGISDVLVGGVSILKSSCTIFKGNASCAVGGIQDNTTIEASFVAQVPRIRESIAPLTPDAIDPNQATGQALKKVTTKENNSVSQAVVAAIKNIIKETPPSVAYSFPYLLFVLLGIMAIVLVYQTKREANQTQETMRLIELDKSVAQQKDNFIMLSSHYVRTPMTVIVTGTELFLSLGKLAQNVAKSIKEALDGLANTVKATFSDIENNVFLKIIKDKGADNELKKAYLSPYLWLPIVLIAGLAFLANYLFESVAKININIINYICEALVFVIASQIFFVFYRKKRLEKANHLKSTLILNKQIIIDNARNDFMKKTAKDIKEKISRLEKALSRAKSRKNLEEVEKGIRDLKKMISKFELLSQIGAGKLKIVSTEFGLLGLVNGMTQERGKKLQEKKIKVKVGQEDMVIKTDKKKLAIILSNVLDNAIEYNKTNGNIKIGFEKEQNKTSITIEDNGVGISKKAQENLFKPFSRGTSTLQFDYEGMGTSLYISKTMANYLGGDVSIESTEGKGTKVTVLINS